MSDQRRKQCNLFAEGLHESLKKKEVVSLYTRKWHRNFIELDDNAANSAEHFGMECEDEYKTTNTLQWKIINYAGTIELVDTNFGTCR